MYRLYIVETNLTPLQDMTKGGHMAKSSDGFMFIGLEDKFIG